MAGKVRKAGGIMDKWRDYFRRSEESDVFDIIEGGIMVAAADYPKEFRVRKDRIAQLLFSAKLSQCVACDRLELFVAINNHNNHNHNNEGNDDYANDDDDHHHVVDDDDDEEEEEEEEFENNKESKFEEGGVDDEKQQSNYSHGDAEALTDEIEKESQMVGEVLRIKGILENSQDEPDMLLVDSLRRLELMDLSVEILKATEIGKAVNVLRKHASKDIRLLARKLIEGWKVMVDEWVTATATMTGTLEGGTPESMNPSTLDEEEGLPSPPLDDLAFFATQPTSMEFSQFFDGIDDDENFGNIMELNKTIEIGRKPRLERPNIVKQRQRLLIESMTPLKDKKDERTRKQESSIKKEATLFKPNKHSIMESGRMRPARPSFKVGNYPKLQQKSEKVTFQRPPVSQQNKLRCSNEQEKLEATKRKLQERYQEAENVKRQRTTKFMEIGDLPKQAPPGHKNFHARPGNNHNRNWANGRR